MLEARAVSFSYRSGFTVADLDLEIPDGCFFGLIGPNGSGKSTLVRLFSRLIRPQKGTLVLDGVALEKFANRELARKVAVIPSENHFDFPFRTVEVVEMGRFAHRGRLQRLTAADHAIVRKALEATDTADLAERAISELSSGERQLVLLARAIAQQPSLLILDEPSAHLDIRHQIAVFRLLRHLNRQEGITLVAVLHDLTSASVFCDRVAVMNRGRMVDQGHPREVINSRMIHEVYGADAQVQRTSEGVPLVTYTAE